MGFSVDLQYIHKWSVILISSSLFYSQWIFILTFNVEQSLLHNRTASTLAQQFRQIYILNISSTPSYTISPLKAYTIETHEIIYYRHPRYPEWGPGRMYVTKSIKADHEDLIHDVAYDFYGRRMATCSSDQKVGSAPAGCLWRLSSVGPSRPFEGLNLDLLILYGLGIRPVHYKVSALEEFFNICFHCSSIGRSHQEINLMLEENIL